MSKKSNKKSAKKKVSKKPVKKKTKAKASKKKPVKKTPKAKKKAAPKKSKAKRPVKKAKKAAKKKLIKKAAPKKVAKPAKKSAKDIKKQPVKIVVPVSKPVINKPIEQKTEAPKKAVKVVKRVTRTPVTPPKKAATIDIKTGPEPPGRFELEYVVHASSQILFEFLTTPSGLSEWFCDDVNIRNGVYSFKWEENEQNARVVRLIDEKTVRFQWVDKTDNSYFEFRIERDDLTNDISLIIADFAETDEEKASSTLLWNSQIDKLLHVLGAYF